MKRHLVFLKIYSGIFALALAVMMCIILLVFYFHAKKQLSHAGENLRNLGNQRIDYSLLIEDSITLNTLVNIDGKLPVNVEMMLSDSIPLSMAVAFNDSLRIPVKLRISEMIGIDTTVTFPNPFLININTTFPVDQKMAVKGLGGLKLNVKTDIPLDQAVLAEIKDSVRIVSSVPIDIMVNQDIPVKLGLEIPINEKINIKLPVREQAFIDFPHSVPFNGYIPIRLKVDISIPLAETSLKKYLDSTAHNLDVLLNPWEE